MRIIHAPPRPGPKALLCRGDEAVVSRLGDGMVERLQRAHLERGTQTRFQIKRRGSLKQEFEAVPGDPEYHAIKFLALALAGRLFPDSVIRMEELRLSRRGPVLRAAYYSEFVPDESGVMGRRGRTSEAYYSADGRRATTRIRENADRVERGLNPDLEALAARFARSGLMMNHPEANYHVAGGKTVFFEIDGLELMGLTGEMHRRGDRGSMLIFAEIYAVAINAWLKNISRSWEGDPWHSANMMAFYSLGLRGLTNLIYHMVRAEDHLMRYMLDESHDIVRYDPLTLVSTMECTRRGRCRLDEFEPPVPIDEDVLLLGR